MNMYLYFVIFEIFGTFFTLNRILEVIVDNFSTRKRKAEGPLEKFLSDDQKKYYETMRKTGSRKPTKAIPKPRVSHHFQVNATCSKW